MAEAAGEPIDPSTPTPQVWREYVSRVSAEAAAELMTEGAAGRFSDFETACDPADPIDQAIMATRMAVFPSHGLMPAP